MEGANLHIDKPARMSMKQISLIHEQVMYLYGKGSD